MSVNPQDRYKGLEWNGRCFDCGEAAPRPAVICDARAVERHAAGAGAKEKNSMSNHGWTTKGIPMELRAEWRDARETKGVEYHLARVVNAQAALITTLLEKLATQRLETLAHKLGEEEARARLDKLNADAAKAEAAKKRGSRRKGPGGAR